MIPASDRRKSLMERVARMRATLDRINSLDVDTVLAGVPSELVGPLSSSRFAGRLAMRRARRLSGDDLFGPALDDREEALIEGGAHSVVALTHAVGAHVMWREVLRLVRRDDLQALSDSLDFPVREAALHGRKRDAGVIGQGATASGLESAIRREGAQSWACWLAAREASSARRLRILTPHSVSTLIADGLSEDDEMRERRRFVVDVELNALVAANADSDEKEVA